MQRKAFGKACTLMAAADIDVPVCLYILKEISFLLGGGKPNQAMDDFRK